MNIMVYMLYIYGCLLTDFTTNLQCGKSRSDCCSGYMYDKHKAICVECLAGYHGPHCNESCPFPSYGVSCRLQCTCEINYCHNVYGCYKEKTAGMASTIASYPKQDILATLKNNSPKNETSISTIVSKMTGVLGTKLNEAPMYKAPEIFSNTESPSNVRAKPPTHTNDARRSVFMCNVLLMQRRRYFWFNARFLDKDGFDLENEII